MFPIEHTEVGCVDIVKHSSCWVEGESGASWQVQQCSHTSLINSLEDPPGVRLESCQPGLTEGLAVPELPLGSLYSSSVLSLQSLLLVPQMKEAPDVLACQILELECTILLGVGLEVEMPVLKPSQRKLSQFWAGLGPCHQNMVILLASPGHSVLRVHQIFSDRHI